MNLRLQEQSADVAHVTENRHGDNAEAGNCNIIFGTKFPVNIEFGSFALMKKIAWSTFLKMRGVVFLELWSSGVVFVLASKRLSKISPFWDYTN